MAGGELARAQFLLLFFTFCSCCISRCISIPSEVTLSPVTHSLLAFQLPCNPRRGGSLDGTAIERAEKRDGGMDDDDHIHFGRAVSVCLCVCVVYVGLFACSSDDSSSSSSLFCRAFLLSVYDLRAVSGGSGRFS